MSALLEVSGVTVTFDGFRAINNLSFNIGTAEMRAVIGPNGAGKTTFMDIVTGKTKPDQGKVLFGPRAESLLSKSEAEIAQIGIGRKFQRPTVFEDQSVEENLRLALKAPRSPWAVLFSRRFRPYPRAGRPSGPIGCAGAQIGRIKPWAKAMVGTGHAVGAGSKIAFGRRTRRWHDTGRTRSHDRHVGRDGQDPRRGRGRT